MKINTQYRRRGSMYFMVLGTSMLVTIIGLSALLAVRIQRRTFEGTNDLAQARLHAQSAIEMGFHRIANAPDWRTYPNGAWESDQPIGGGKYTLEGIDPEDGDLSDDEADLVVLTGIGMQGDARYKLQVTLVAELPALTCLEVALCTAGNLNILKNATANCDQIISSNSSVTGVKTSQINGDLEAVGSVTGVTVNGTATTGVTPRTMPDTNTVYDYYIANGTPISRNAIPYQVGVFLIPGVVLSPTSNPFGAGTTNPEGIYVIDAGGFEFQIIDSRIVGTLVILNGGVSGTWVQSGVNWEPAVPNYPALLVQGPLYLNWDRTIPIVESAEANNLNPEGTPYGDPLNWDSDTDDTYPSIINGLVYAETLVDIRTSPVINGAVISGGVANLGSALELDLTFDRTYLDNPPPGFRGAPRMVISPGSWRQVPIG